MSISPFVNFALNVSASSSPRSFTAPLLCKSLFMSVAYPIVPFSSLSIRFFSYNMLSLPSSALLIGDLRLDLPAELILLMLFLIGLFIGLLMELLLGLPRVDPLFLSDKELPFASISESDDSSEIIELGSGSLKSPENNKLSLLFVCLFGTTFSLSGSIIFTKNSAKLL